MRPLDSYTYPDIRMSSQATETDARKAQSVIAAVVHDIAIEPADREPELRDVLDMLGLNRKISGHEYGVTDEEQM